MAATLDDPAQPPRIYQGWLVAAAGFVCAASLIGSVIYCFGLFVVPLSQEFGLARGSVNNGLILVMVGMAIWSPLAGRALDRLPAPAVMLFGAAMTALGFGTIARTSSLELMAAAAVGPVALGMSCAGGMAAHTVAARWFRAHRGRAMGLLSVSSGAGGFAMVWIAGQWIAREGWRDALAGLGIAVPAVIALAAALFIRSRPSEAQLRASGELTPAATPGGEPLRDEPLRDEPDWTLRQLAGTRNFWLISSGTGILLASDQAVLVSKVPYLLDAGVSLEAASFLMSCQTASAVCGKIGIGLLADRTDLRRLFAAVAACHVVFLLALIFYPGYWALLAIACVVGVAIGGVYPVWTTTTAWVFGAKSYGTVMGAMNFLLQPMSMLALYFVGRVYDSSHSYTPAFSVFLALVALSVVLILNVRAQPAVGRA